MHKDETRGKGKVHLIELQKESTENMQKLSERQQKNFHN